MKRVVYAHDFVFLHKSNNSYTAVGMPEEYFTRFFDAGFQEVSIVSRGSFYQGQKGYELIRSSKINFPVKLNSSYISLFSPSCLGRIYKILKDSDFVVVNLPSIVGTIVVLMCFIMGKPYAVELAADLNAFSTKKFGKLVSLFHSITLPFFIKRAKGVAYVGEHLQRRYPTQGSSLVASNVNLKFLRPCARVKIVDPERVRVGFAGALNRRKGIQTIIKACETLVNNGVDNVEFHLLGGHEDRDWSKIIYKAGLSNYFVFHGVVPHEKVAVMMDQFDIYIQPSYNEGIPRATIEAMGCALPVVATDLPGFRVLLDNDMLVPVGDFLLLAKKIEHLIESCSSYRKYSSDNLNRATSFSYDKLSITRAEFFRQLFKEHA